MSVRSFMPNAGIAIAILCYFAVNIGAGHFFPMTRIDLTEHSIYSLTGGSKDIISKLPEPVVLRLFVSKSKIVKLPALSSYAAHVEDLLKEYERESGGMIRLQIIEPEPFSVEEDRAVGFGMQGFPVTRSDELGYFGLAGTNELGERQSIPIFSPEREALLEYELTRLIFRLGNPERKVVGIISSLPIQGVAGPQSLAGVSAQPWLFYRQLNELFEVRMLRPRGEPLPDDIDMLALIHPKNLHQNDLYEIDQFALKGKGLLVVVDPHSEANAALLRNVPQIDSSNTGSQLDIITSGWGVSLLRGEIVADLPVAARVVDPQGTTGQTIEYPVWMNVQPEQLNQSDSVTTNLGNIVFASAGSLQLDAQSTTELTPLIVTTPQSALYDYDVGTSTENIRNLLAAYEVGGQPHVLAVRISGEAVSGFTSDDAVSTIAKSKFLERGSVNAIVISDTDFLQDHFWVRSERLGETVLNFASASNGQLIENAVDNLAGDEALIGIRARGSYFRTFGRLQEIRRNAELKFLQHEQQLMEQLKRIDQLVADFGESQNSETGGLILTDDQRQDFRNARARQLQLRGELREVRRNLHRDIERIESIIVLVNAVMVPLVVGAIGFIFAMIGIKRRDRRLARAIASANAAS